MDDKKVELHDIDLISYVAEANRRAMQEGIKANSIMINDRLVKTNSFVFRFCNGTVAQMPPMICGLEAHITDELPDEYAFAVLEKPQTERDKIVEQTRKDTVREFVGKIKELIHGFENISQDTDDCLCEQIDELAKEYGLEVEE